jgi:hypothetical protein
MVCVLSDRLYVPEEYVTEEHLKAFTYEFTEEEISSEMDSGDEANPFTTITTYNQLEDESGKKYYGFSRGNLSKLGKFFGDLDWEDKTAAPDFTYSLEFAKGIRLFNYERDGRGQDEAVEAWLKRKSGIIRAAPRFGKTISAINIITRLKKKALIVAHQVDLLDQFYKSFMDFTNLKEIQGKVRRYGNKDATGMVVGFFNEYENPEELDVCLLCWQTFASKYGEERIEKYRDTWGIICVDEIHRSGGLKYAVVLNQSNSRYRLGLTGTVERVDTRERIIKDIMGPVVAEGRVKKVPCKVVVIKTGLSVEWQTGEPLPYLHKRLHWCKERNNIILYFLRKDVAEGRFICMAFHRYSSEQLQKYTDYLKKLGFKAEAFYGTMKRDRKEVLNEIRDGTVQVAVCNSSMLTGIDIPRWDCFYAMFPNSNIVFNKQGKLSGNYYQDFSRITTNFVYEDGRVKDYGLIRDFADNVSICYGSLKKREKAYASQGFEVSYIKIKSRKEKLTDGF